MDAAPPHFVRGRERIGLSGGGGGGGGFGGVEIMQDAEERGGDRNQECKGIFMPSISHTLAEERQRLSCLYGLFGGRW